MSPQELQRRTVATSLGTLSFWGRPEAADASRPVLVALAGSFMTLKAINQLPRLLDETCHVVVAELPLLGAEALEHPTLGRLADHVGHAVHAAFRGRTTVLAGFGDAALVAAIATAPEIVKRVVIEPPMASARLWPLRAAIRQRLEAKPDRPMAVFLAEVYGATDAGEEPREHRAAFRGLRSPVDVVVGERPLMPERAVERAPSHVDDDDRAWLAGQANVTVRVAPGAGHAVGQESSNFALEALSAAVTWAVGVRRQPADLAAALARATPRDAGRFLYVGPEAAAFEAAYGPLNPQGRVVTALAAGEPFEAAVLLHPEGDLADVAAGLAPGGTVIAATHLGPGGAEIEGRLLALGLTPVASDPAIVPMGAAVVRARKTPAAAATRVDIIPYARTLMDIRTRLPANALRSDPALEVNYHVPPFAQDAANTRPYVMVLQRPALWSVPQWRALAARALRARQVVVLEFDDHPELIARMVQGKAMEADGWERFRVVHAIQTSTEQLGEVFRAHNPEVRVFPNAVFELKPFPAGPRAPRVFYGGVTRGPFAADVARALAPAIAAHPDTEFQVVGDRAVFDALPTGNKAFSDYVSYERYLEMMAGCSVSLSPLEDQPMAETKSDAKYLDAARAGVLTIASPTVYARAIRSGENGLIAQGLEDWPRMLALALGDPAARERMARAAWEEMRDRRMFAHQLPERRDWYADLLTRREALDRAILQRAPEVAEMLARFGGLPPASDNYTS